MQHVVPAVALMWLRFFSGLGHGCVMDALRRAPKRMRRDGEQAAHLSPIALKLAGILDLNTNPAEPAPLKGW